MRILMLTSSFPISPDEGYNAGVFVREVALGLARMGHEVLVLTPSKSKPVRDPVLQVCTFPWLGAFSDLASLPPHVGNLIRFLSLLASGAWATWRWIRCWRPAMALAMWAIPSGALAYLVGRKTGLPYGVWALGSDVWGRRRYPLGERIVRRVLQGARFRLADGWGLAREVSELSGRPCAFLPSARSLPLEVPPASLPSDQVHLAFLGRFERPKGIDLLVEALAPLVWNARRTEFHVHLMGDGSMRSAVEQAIAHHRLDPWFTRYGYVGPRQVTALLKASDYLVIPSRVESIPVAFSDAMQCGLPVIVTDVGDLGLLTRHWQVGWVAGPPEPAALTESLRRAMEDRGRQACFRKNTARAAAFFRIDRIVDRVSAILEGKIDEEGLTAELLDVLGDPAGSGPASS